MNNVTLDKKRPIRFTHSVLMKVEDERGKSFLNIEVEKLTFGDLIVMCYYACLKADPDFNLTVEDVGDNFKADTAVEVMNCFASDMMKDEKK